MSLFIAYNNISEEAETAMLITEIIKVKETSELKDKKKTNDSEIKTIDKINEEIKKREKEHIPFEVVLKPEDIPKKFESRKLDNKEEKNDDKNALVKNKKKEIINSPNKNPIDYKSSENKNASKATYKIGSIKNPHPPYPIVARKKGLQGKLILKVSISNDGSVKNVVVLKSSGHKILDKVSKETVEKWVFIPAKKMGKAVEDNLKVPIRFVLTE